jgi:hypothetical protein
MLLDHQQSRMIVPRGLYLFYAVVSVDVADEVDEGVLEVLEDVVVAQDVALED